MSTRDSSLCSKGGMRTVHPPILSILSIPPRPLPTAMERRTSMTVLLSESIEMVITRLYAEPQPRKGDRSGRLWWVCPFHADRNPSLCVAPGNSKFHCFGCDAKGDAIQFARLLHPEFSFQQA